MKNNVHPINISYSNGREIIFSKETKSKSQKWVIMRYSSQQPTLRRSDALSLPASTPSSHSHAVTAAVSTDLLLSFAHSSGVWHLALHAWMLLISSRRAALTRRWRLSELSPENCGDTMMAVNAWPQPPGAVRDGKGWEQDTGDRTYQTRP